ncbi:MAG: phage tail tape measure protein [Beijerinckiaceae bacterium]
MVAAADSLFVSIGVDEAAYAASLRRMIGVTNAAAAQIEGAFGKIAATGTGATGGFVRDFERNGQRMQAAGFGWGSGLKGIAVQMAGFALIMGAAGAGGTAIKAMADFEQQLAMLQVIANESADALTPLRDQALKLGQDTALAANDVATLQTELAKLGYSLAEIEKLTPGGVNLSIVADMPAESAAEFLGAVVNQFKAAPEEVNRYVDVLAAAANRTAADIDELAFSFKYVGAPARAAGASIEQVSAILGVAADNGIAAMTAGTSLRSAFQDLAQMLPITTMGLAQYGIKVDMSKTAVERFYDVLKEIEEKNINPLAIRGLESDTATLLSALKGSSERLRTLAVDLRNVDGEAKRVADAKMGGLTGAARELTGAFDTLAIRLGDTGFIDVVTGSVRGLTSAIEGLTSLTVAVDSFFTSIANSPAAREVRELFDSVGAAISAQAAKNAGNRQSLFDAMTFGQGSRVINSPLARGTAAFFGFDPAADAGADGQTVGARAGAPTATRPKNTTPPFRPPAQPLVLTAGQQRAREITQLKELAASAEEGARALARMQAVQAEENAGLMEGGISRATAERRALQKEELNGVIERAQKQQAADQSWLDMQDQRAAAQRDFMSALSTTNDEQNLLTAAAKEGVGAYERMAIAVDLMRQNTALTKEEALALAGTIHAGAKENERAVESMRRVQQAGIEMGEAVAGAFEDMIIQGGSFKDILRSLAVDILRIGIRTAITAPLGAALGNIFGGARANGGPVAAGMAYTVGERGRETFIPSMPGKIVPGVVSGGGGLVFNDNRVIDARGADPAAIARLERALAADRAGRRMEIAATVADMRARGRA